MIKYIESKIIESVPKMFFALLILMAMYGGMIAMDTQVIKMATEVFPAYAYTERAKEEKVLTVKEHICNATDGENCDVLYNLCKKESGRYIVLPGTEPCQQYSVGHNTNGTKDYSWFQINEVHIIGRSASNGRGTITIECAYDLYCASRWANEQIKSGNGHIWVAWKNI